MGHPIRVPDQPIRGPIQRCFGLSCDRRVYFLRKSKEIHDMLTECQRINTSHSFLTVLLIYNKFLAVSWSLAPLSLPNCSPIYPQSLPGLLKLFCRTSYFPKKLQTWTLLQRYTFLIRLLLQWMNLITEYSQVQPCIPNPPTVLPTL